VPGSGPLGSKTAHFGVGSFPVEAITSCCRALSLVQRMFSRRDDVFKTHILRTPTKPLKKRQHAEDRSFPICVKSLPYPVQPGDQTTDRDVPQPGNQPYRRTRRTGGLVTRADNLHSGHSYRRAAECRKARRESDDMSTQSSKDIDAHRDSCRRCQIGPPEPLCQKSNLCSPFAHCSRATQPLRHPTNFSGTPMNLQNHCWDCSATEDGIHCRVESAWGGSSVQNRRHERRGG
jgi:hypothetical protein